MADLSLAATLTRRLLGALGVIVLATGAVIYVVGGRYVDLAYDRALYDDAETVAAQVEARGSEPHLSLPASAQALLLADESDRVIYRVIDLAAQRVIDGNGDLGAWDARLPAATPGFRDAHVEGVDFRVAYLRRDLTPGPQSVMVEVAETRGKRDRVRHDILLGTAALMVLLATTCVAVLRFGIRDALAPLAALTAEAALRSGDNLAPLDPMVAPRETRALIEAVNRMMARVAQAVAAQRRFVANASHQLRTPIAGLRLQAQLALRGDAPAPVIEHLREIETSATRAAHLIDQLLVLSAADEDRFAASHTQVDLARVAQQVIERAMTAALRRRVTLDYDGPDDGPVVVGNPMLLGELVANLVDNAVRYTPAGSHATVVVVDGTGEAGIGVADDGPGLPMPAERLFQRFVRADTEDGAAGRPREDRGSGLGLAIVHEIAERHGGRVTVDSAPGKGTRIVAWLRRS